MARSRNFYTAAVASVLFSAGIMTATAEQKSELIVSAKEARQELFGVRLEGVTAGAQQPWTECIQPDGKTVYNIDGTELVGRLEVTDEGQACFSYAYDDYQRQNCFRVSRQELGYTFWGGMEGVYRTTSVEKDVQQCPVSSTPIS